MTVVVRRRGAVFGQPPFAIERAVFSEEAEAPLDVK
jgi:hypothetical protein